MHIDANSHIVPLVTIQTCAITQDSKKQWTIIAISSICFFVVMCLTLIQICAVWFNMCGNTQFLTYSLYKEHKMNEDKHMLILHAHILYLRSYHTEFYKTWYWGYTESCSINFILICIGIIKPLFYSKQKPSSTDFLEDGLYKILIHDKKCRDSSIRTTTVIKNSSDIKNIKCKQKYTQSVSYACCFIPLC